MILGISLGGIRMIKSKNNLLTSSEFTYLLLGYVVATGFLKLPNELVKTAEQDAWISVIIALIYPIYLVLISSYIISKHPKENILCLTKKYFGTLLGSVFNFIFMFQFLLLAAVSVADFIFLTRTFIVPFLTPFKIAVLTVSLGAYAAYNGLKVLAKLNQLIFYLFGILFLLSLTALKQGSILNLQPVFGSGLSNILKTSLSTAYSYFGWEALLLFYPYVEDTKVIKKSAMKGIAICVAVYVWSVFITIFYLGIDVTVKSYWSFIFVFESITIPVINNFRYVFMLVWFLLSFRLTANSYFAFAFNLNDFIKTDTKKACLLVYPIVLYASIKLSNRMLRTKMVSFLTPIFIIYSAVLITITALIILFKHKKA